MPKAKAAPKKKSAKAETYRHPTADLILRPDVGTQAQFKKAKPPKKYRYDSSLSPALEWDGQNGAREQGDALIRRILDAKTVEDAKAAAHELKALGRPFLNWAGRAERLSFDVPTFPLFIHERLSTKAITETLKGHKRDKQESMLDLFGDPQHSITDQVLRAYEHRDKWVNRMVLGDGAVVMNSLLEYEGLGGQVQMIYMDPPYGVRFGSNFQPFVRNRDVKHNEDDHLTREPEMVQAYRDTWEFGVHSYLTYLRDRLLLCRDLLHQSGSLFVQISDENVHHVRELLDEIFGPQNRAGIIQFVKTSGLAAAGTLTSACDYLLWYGRDLERMKYRELFVRRDPASEGAALYSLVELPDGTRRSLTKAERDGTQPLPDGARRYRVDNLTKPGPGSKFEFEFEGRRFSPGRRWWGTTPEGMSKLAEANRLSASGDNLWYVRFWDDFPFRAINNLWTDTSTGGFAEERLYVVQTGTKVLERCILMTTDPGDLVFDPTCGSGTTAYVAENWGRRWITADISRVPMALARQRLLTATFPWYELKDDSSGPAGGFVFKRRKNNKGDEVGGIVPHVTLKTIVNNEPPGEEVLADRPEVTSGVTRVTGPFCVEATIPTPVDWEGDGVEDTGSADVYGSFVARMLEALRRSPVLHLGGKKSVNLKNVRSPAKTLSLSAEALTAQNGDKPVAFVFGPENGAVSEKLVWEAAREAKAKDYTHLYVVGFSVQPHARQLVENSHAMVGIPATYVQATPDFLLGDLLKTMRSSEIFSVCGLPEIEVKKLKDGKHQVQLLGLDVFDPTTMDAVHRDGDDVPAWLLDTDYNGLVFYVRQAFFPRTGAWDNLRKALKAEYDESVWDHLAGTTSAPFEAGEHRQVAVKVIDDRGNELLVVESLGGSR